MDGAVTKFSDDFKLRVGGIQCRLKQAALNCQREEIKALLIDAHSLGLEAEVASAVLVLQKQILNFIEKMMNLTLSSPSKEEHLTTNWLHLKLEGEKLGLATHVLEVLRRSIWKRAELEHTKMDRTIIVVFECDEKGNPERHCHGSDGAKLYIKTMALCGATSGENPKQRSHKSIQQGPFNRGCEISPSVLSLRRGIPLQYVQHNWHQVENLRSSWQHQYIQRNPGVYAMKPRVSVGHPSVHSSHCSKQQDAQYLHHMEMREEPEDGEEGEDLEINNEGIEEEHEWLVERLQQLDHNRCLPSSELTQAMVERSSDCSKDALHGLIKLNLAHEELSSLGEGNLARWCPKLRTFMVDMNRLFTLRGAFQGLEQTLEYVYVKDNLLSDLVGLESLSNMKVLYLEGNSITQISVSQQTQHKAEEKDFYEDPIYSTARPSPTSLIEIHDLGRGRKCTGICSGTETDIYIHANAWPRLKKLCLGFNKLTKVSRMGILCPNLEVLDLGSNLLVTLGGYEESALLGLQQLRILDVAQNRLKGRSLWEGLKHCPMLVSLVASRNQLTELPTHLGSAMLRDIWLNGNAIRRLACKAWLPNLQRLYLQDNLIDTLEPLWGCPSLEASLKLHLTS